MGAFYSEFKVFAGNGNPELAREICECLGVPLGAADVKKFSDGEIAVNISIYDAAGNWSASGLHIGYDTRLTLVPRSDGKPFEVGDACTPLMNSIRKIKNSS